MMIKCPSCSHSFEAECNPLPMRNEVQLASEIYALYPRKVGKPEAIKSIVRALKKFPSDLLRERTAAYAGIVRGTDTMIPNPSTWFNQERFNDDPCTWCRQSAQPQIFTAQTMGDLRMQMEVIEERLKQITVERQTLGDNYARVAVEGKESEVKLLRGKLKEVKLKIARAL